MENIDNISNLEMEEMRQQMQLLKQKLDDQTIVSERQLSNAMSGKMTWIMKYIWFELWGLFPLCVLSFIGSKMLTPSLSWGPIVSILLLVLGEILVDLYVNRMKESDWQSENLLATADKLVRMKRIRWWQVIISLPIAVALFWWLAMGYPESIRAYMGWCMAIGGIIGLSVGIAILLRMQRTNDELIRQIREMKS